MRRLPEWIQGYGAVKPFTGIKPPPAQVIRAATKVCPGVRGKEKLLSSIDDAFVACGIRDGATLSFHHHLRNGDQVLNLVLEVAARRGLRDLTIAPSSIFPVHAPLVKHLKTGVVRRIFTAFMAGPVARAVSEGLMQTPAVMTTHGGRARSIESGELRIDVAFIAAPGADRHGNLSGAVGRAACGPLGYAMVDAHHAERVVAITEEFLSAPPTPLDISQECVDFVVKVDSIGNPAGILSGSTIPTTERIGLQIAENAARVIEASGLLREGFSFQTGAGSVSIASASYVRELMRKGRIVGDFCAGGVTATQVDMLEEGLFRNIYDVQCFDPRAVASYFKDRRHLSMSASMYANPHARAPLVERLDAMLLGAAEVDLDFNVNVSTGSGGNILGGSGGHADTAAGSRLSIVTTRLTSSAGAKIVKGVGCITTPGESIDVVVTEAGIAVNPTRPDLQERVSAAGINVLSMSALRECAVNLHRIDSKHMRVIDEDSPIVAVVEYRDGRVTDVIRRVD